MISRRGFLGSLVGGVAVAAAAQTFPFRVFSFSSRIAPYVDYANFSDFALTNIYYDRQALECLKSNLTFEHLATRKEIPRNIGRSVSLFSVGG